MKPNLHRCRLGARVATTRTVGRAAPSAPQGGPASVPAETEWRRCAVDVRYGMLDGQVWLAQTNTVSCSDSSIAPLVTSTARQLTGLAAAAPSRSTATDERGNTTESWTTVGGGIVTRHRRVSYATNVAETTLRYGDVVREISVSGVTDTYAYDALGRQVSHTDGRGNTSRTEYNARGLRSASIDALGNRTAYAYDQYGNLSAVTNPLGNAVVYEYDLRGRKIYEGGATYPVRYTYDVFGNRTTMTTYRNESLGPASGDVTTWRYDEASNCMTNKVYADGKGPRYGYTQDGKLAQRIWARGIVTGYSYDGWGSLTNTVYSDATTTVTLFYDAMGRQTNAVDAAGVTSFAYDDYGSVVNETVVGPAGENTIVRHWDAYGRTVGYSLVGRAAPSAPQRQTTIGYNAATGRIATMLANGSDVPFTWSYLPGSDLKSSLAYPNGLIASWTYDDNGQLLQVRNAVVATAPSPSETEVISQYDYVYDNAGRRISCAKSGSSFTQNDALSYGYNEKSELTNAVAAVDSDYRYAYDFDEIGNRESANERGTNAAYMANQLNQYTAVDDFTPQFDDDGNQTLVKTATGIWTVAYNGENRPVLWTGGTTNIVMKYDRMGRRVEYLETVGGSPSSVTVTNAHHRFVYDGYLCVQRLNAAANNAVDLAFGWDPTEPVATRPLWMQRVSGSYNFFYFHDGNKNVSDLVSYQSARGVPAHYEYAPFGAMTAATTNTAFTAFNAASVNPYRFSSEYADDALGLVYYNYRHYNTADGRWMNYDRHNPFAGYVFVMNDGIGQTDYLGLESSSSALAPSQRGRDCIYRVYVADGISDPDLSLWTSYCSQKFPKYPNGDRYGYWGCGANVINEMTGNEHPGFELPVVLPKGKRANEDMQTDLGKRGMKPNYAEKFETISGSPNPFLVKTIERLKRFAKEDSGDMDCRCKSITIKIDCSNTLRNAEVFELLSDKERYKVFNEVERRKKYDKYSVFKIAYELYSAMYKEKLKCGTKTIVE